MKKPLLVLFYLMLPLFSFSQATTAILNSPAADSALHVTCLGGLYDSGGTGAAMDYGNDEDFVITICPDTPTDKINLLWTTFDLDGTDLVPGPPTDADNITIYDGDDMSAPTLGTYYAGDLDPGDVFGATLGNPTGCLTIRFRSNAEGTGNFTAQISCATPCDNPFADAILEDADSPAGDSIAVCVGEGVTFSDAGSYADGMFTLETWVWHWNDGTTDTAYTADPIDHAYDIPGAYIPYLEVIDDNGCSSTNIPAMAVFVSTYPTFTGFPSDTTLCLGESIELEATPDLYGELWAGFESGIVDSDNCMEDLTGIAQYTPLVITGHEDTEISALIPDILSICVDIEHSYIGDFVLQVQCPSGQIMTLHEQLGGGTYLGEPVDDIIDCDDPATFGTPYNYCFTPDATETWADVAIPMPGGESVPAGDYAPVDTLGFSALDGCPVNGTWNLIFTDLWGADDGSIPGWSITFADYLLPDVIEFTPTIGSGPDSSYWDITGDFIIDSSDDLDIINVAPTAAGTFDYNYFVVNNFGCAFDTTITITVEDLAPISAGLDTTICVGDSVLLGDDIACTYTLELFDSFGDGWNDNTINLNVDGDFSVHTIATGDSYTYEFEVNHGSSIDLQFNEIGGWPTECAIFLYNSAGELVYSDGEGFVAPTTDLVSIIADCFGDYTLVWTPTEFFPGGDLPYPTPVYTEEDTTFVLTSYPTGHPDCAYTDSVTISVVETPDPGLDNTVELCPGGIAVDLYDYLLGTPDLGGAWQDADSNEVIMPFDPSTMPEGTYEYYFDEACYVSAYIEVTYFELSMEIAEVDASCNTVCDGSVTITADFATAFTLTDPDGVDATNDTGIFDGLCAGDYTIVAVNAEGCTLDSTFTITEPDPVTITSITDDLSICEGESITLNADLTGGATPYVYSWEAGGTVIGTENPLTWTPTASTEICLIAQEECASPADTACMNVTIIQPPIINITSDVVNGCAPLTVTFDDISTYFSPVTVNFSTGDGSLFIEDGGSDYTHTYDTPGIYDISMEITSDEGCIYTQDFINYIEVFEKPNANFSATAWSVSSADPEVDLTDLSSSDVVNWEWYFGSEVTPSTSNDQNPTIRFPEFEVNDYEIMLRVTNENSCIDSITKIINVVGDVFLYAPNAFTPDHDEYNQGWRVYITGIDIYDFHLTIFNRWGEIVWESFNPEATWYGTYGEASSGLVQDGTYIWSISTKDMQTDKIYKFNGAVTILK